MVSPSESFEEQAAFFKALGDPHRLAILAALMRAGEPVCVCDFTSELPLNQPTVSHHLKILRDLGIVSGVRRGTWVYYSLTVDIGARVRKHLDSLETPRSKIKHRRAS